MILLKKENKKVLEGAVSLPASKSISNRVLLIRHLCKEPFTIHNLSDANDTILLQKLLTEIREAKKVDQNPLVLNAQDAGTTFRFLTALLAGEEGDWILSGSPRMQKRPIGPLVKALRKLGGEVEYGVETFVPPLNIKGRKINGGTVEIPANISSQFISALLLVAPTFRDGLTIRLTQYVTSQPYIIMTLKVMEYFGVHAEYKDKKIVIEKQSYQARDISIESDWSAASYFYSLAALSEECRLFIHGLQSGGWQGDSILSHLMEKFGVHTEFTDKGALLHRIPSSDYGFNINFLDNPDLAQTLAVTAALLKKPLSMSGVATLQFKETDRIKALDSELNKIGFYLEAKGRWFYLKAITKQGIQSKVQIGTYNDHRMAMAFSALVMRYQEVLIEDEDVVNKSFPSYWKELSKCGIESVSI